MVDDRVFDEGLAEAEEGPVLPRRRVRDTADLDITPMIDIVFLLLIFFLVASIPNMQVAADLPAARYGKGVNARTAIIFTVAERGGPGSALVYLGDGKRGSRLPADSAGQEAAIAMALSGKGGTLLPDDPATQEEIVRRAVAQGFYEGGRSAVLVKAEKAVRYRDVSRVTSAVGAAQAEGIQLHLAVYEIE
jgi:biopolymer transport protein ExbD